MSSPTLDHDAVLETIRRWPRDAQVALAREIMQEMSASPTGTRSLEDAAGGRGLHDLLGLFATDQPAPSDEEIERWREEWRMEKYGR